MAQPAQANPFAVPPSAGAPPLGDPNMQQQQPMQTGNPFGGFAAAPAPTQPSDPFSAAPMQMPNGTGAPVPLQQQQQSPPMQFQPPQPQQQQVQAPYQSSDPFAAPPSQASVPNDGSSVASAPQQQQPPPMQQAQPPPQQQQNQQAQPFQSNDPFAAPSAQAPVPNDGSSVASPPQQPQPPPMTGQQQQQQMHAPMQASDPFSAPPAQAPVQNGGAAVPPPQAQFASFAQVPPPQQQSQQQGQPQFGVQQQQGMQQQPQFQQQQPQQSGMQQQGMMAAPPPFGQQQVPQQTQAPQPGQQPVDPFSNALVPSAQPTNPYAQSMVQQPGAQPVAQQQPVDPFGGGQAMVPAAQSQQSQWAVPGAAPVAAVNPFDPFAPPPPPPPVPAPAPPPQQSNELVPAGQQANYQAPEFPFDPDQVQQAPAQEEEKPQEQAGSVGPPINEVNAIHGHGAQSVVSEPETTMTRRSDDHGYSGGGEMVVHQPQVNLQNKYSKELARNAPPGCAPLPKGELVVKSGYILSRISFRTILMKKWKQTYWVQYGRHTMLWFRSETQFNEWLSNPYLSQAQRNFLVKLAINFVHDLYKPNVRGYQVTQAHTKPYGRKMVRQFKLERWMDYGPTIAAAFGSVDTREVDVLRQTIIDCMRNTPLENGIRATGAVRQDHDQEHRNDHGEQRFSYDDHQSPRGEPYEMSNARLDGDGYNRSSGPVERSFSAPAGGRSVVSENPNDFLSDQRAGFDETASYGGYSSGQYQNYSQAPSQRQAYSQYAYR